MALGLIGALSEAPTVARAVDVFQQAIEPFGVTVFRTGAVGNPARSDIAAATISTWSPEWEEFYVGARAFTFDPIAQATMKGAEGFFWKDVPSPPAQAKRRLMHDAAEIGMVDGFVAMRAPPGELKSFVTMSSPVELEWTSLERGVVSFMANSLMSRLLHLREVQLAPKVLETSERERDILHRAALGRSDKRIALELGCAHDTVRAHWRSIRRKLAAADRAQAVAVAIWSGQIAP